MAFRWSAARPSRGTSRTRRSRTRPTARRRARTSPAQGGASSSTTGCRCRVTASSGARRRDAARALADAAGRARGSLQRRSDRPPRRTGRVPARRPRHGEGVRARRGDGFVLSNSVDAVRLLTGASEPTPSGCRSMLGFGWAAGGRTLLDGVRLVEGGRLHDLTARTVSRRRPSPLRPATTLGAAPPRRRAVARPTARGRRRAVSPLTCGLTAGRDTRVVLALALAAGLDVDYYTSGHETDVDVVIARELAEAFGLRHELVTPRVPDDWTRGDDRRSAPRRTAWRASGSSPTGSSTRG